MVSPVGVCADSINAIRCKQFDTKYGSILSLGNNISAIFRYKVTDPNFSHGHIGPFL